MVKRECGEDLRFTIVGPDYQRQEMEKRASEKKNQPGTGKRQRGKPLPAAGVLILIVAGCLGAPLIANHDPAGFYLEALNRPPDREFYFGTDSLGRDLFSILFYGGRASLGIGLLSAAVTAAIGIPYGCVSGTAGDRVDAVMMRITEFFGSVPSILTVLILTAVIPADDIVGMSLVIGLTGWFSLARMVRSEVRQIRHSEYVLYARCTGGSFLYVMLYHLIPNCLPAVMFAMVSNISAAITMESTLSFLGLGLPPDQLSWGSMLSLANRALLMNTWWVIVIPGLFLVVTLLCITDIGNYIWRELSRRSS